MRAPDAENKLHGRTTIGIRTQGKRRRKLRGSKRMARELLNSTTTTLKTVLCVLIDDNRSNIVIKYVSVSVPNRCVHIGDVCCGRNLKAYILLRSSQWADVYLKSLSSIDEKDL